jgi:hypothetical protein
MRISWRRLARALARWRTWELARDGQPKKRGRPKKLDAKFICMTGNSEADRLEGVIVLDKPFSAEKLLLSVDQLLRSSVSTP